MTSVSASGALKQTNWAARVFWGVSAIFVVIGGGMEAYVYFAFTDQNLWTWVGVAEALARAICTQAVIMVLTLAGVKLWQGGAHVIWKALLFIFFQIIALGAATHGFVLVWVAAVAFRRADLLGTADQGVIDIPFLGTFQLAMIVLTLIAAMPYYEVILSLIGPIVTKERRALSPQEIREMRERETELRALQAERQEGMGQTLLRMRKSAGALITGKMDDPNPATNTLSYEGPNSDGFGAQTLAGEGEVLGEKYGASRGNLRALAAGGTLPKTYAKAEDILAYVNDTLGRTDVTLSQVKDWLPQQDKAFRADGKKSPLNPKGYSLTGGQYVMLKSTAFAAAKRKWPAQALALVANE